MPNKDIVLTIRGVPQKAPSVGDQFDAYILIQDLSNSSSLTDVVRVSWNVWNGPTATVSVVDMYTNSNKAVLTDFKVDTSSQDWKVTVNPEEEFNCYKVNSQGCDVLTTRITKTNWGEYDTNQDVTYNAVRFNFNI